MALTQKITCDVCGKEKQQTNHWWMLGFGLNSVTLLAWQEKAIGTIKHYCGQECVNKAVSQWMQMQSEAPKSA